MKLIHLDLILSKLYCCLMANYYPTHEQFFLRLETCRIGTNVYFLCSYSIGLQSKQMAAAKMCKVGSYEIGHTSSGLINHSGVYKSMNA